MAQIRQVVLILILILVLHGPVESQTPKFFDDDPIQAVPPPLTVTTTVVRDIDQTYDFLRQSKRPEPRPASPAGEVNTLGEVPDNDWFTNRHGLRRMTREQLQQGPGPASTPQPPFTILSGKNEGIMPGYSFKDSTGMVYFAKVDPRRYPEMATAAEVIVSRFLYAIGYNTPKNEIVNVHLSDLRLAHDAKITLPDGSSRAMTWWDVEEFADNTYRYPDGSFRIVASPEVEGEIIGHFRYEGTRRDDPNDIVPHQNRRDLRGLYVAAAWLNSTDMKAGNTLDTIVEENGTRFIRHYLFDFSSALGSDGNRAKSVRTGNRFMLPTPMEAFVKVFSVRLMPEPWETASFPDLPSVGNFESEIFDPDAWTSNYPNPAFLSRLSDDDYWGAKQVMAFTDDDIRAIVETAKFSDPHAADYIVATLERRRDKIGRVFFSRLLPLDHFRVEGDELLYDDLAVKYGFIIPRPYEVRWTRFDNVHQKHEPISGSGSNRLPAEVRQAPAGSYFSAVFRRSADQLKPVFVYVRKETNGYRVVGIDRT
jgi:hypothetical protein